MLDGRVRSGSTRHPKKSEGAMTVESLARDRGLVRETFAYLTSWRERLALALERWREHAELRREFDELRQRGELDRTLSDSGIDYCDIPRLMRAHPRTPQQLAEMMRRQGLNRRDLPHHPAIAAALREMEWRCGACANWRKCRAWLAEREP